MKRQFLGERITVLVAAIIMVLAPHGAAAAVEVDQADFAAPEIYDDIVGDSDSDGVMQNGGTVNSVRTFTGLAVPSRNVLLIRIAPTNLCP